MTLLGFLDLALLDPINEAIPPKLKLEQIKSDFAKTKEKMLDITQITMEEIKQLIKIPLGSLMGIDMFIKEWTKIKKK